MSSESYHEPYELLTPPTRDLHRAIVTLMEELEAIDWYQQRADVCDDDELRSVLLHNKNEEIEHAMMVLEWVRRKSPTFDEHIRTYLMADGPITEIEATKKAAEVAGQGGSGDSGAGQGASEDSAPVARPSGGRAPAAAGGAGRPLLGSLGIGSLKEG